MPGPDQNTTIVAPAAKVMLPHEQWFYLRIDAINTKRVPQGISNDIEMRKDSSQAVRNRMLEYFKDKNSEIPNLALPAQNGVIANVDPFVPLGVKGVFLSENSRAGQIKKTTFYTLGGAALGFAARLIAARFIVPAILVGAAIGCVASITKWWTPQVDLRKPNNGYDDYLI